MFVYHSCKMDVRLGLWVRDGPGPDTWLHLHTSQKSKGLSGRVLVMDLVLVTDLTPGFLESLVHWVLTGLALELKNVEKKSLY